MLHSNFIPDINPELPKSLLRTFIRTQNAPVWNYEELYYQMKFTRGGESTPYNGLYEEAPPERGTFFRLEVYKRVGISRAEACGKTHLSIKRDFQNISNRLT